ncbi:hypothetical protein BJV78DRAFT_797054 [Lactifluus subvellereus]|nr:hypothetical protein BJV78DRAFT_797054 [Lactifluus subvellereus]
MKPSLKRSVLIGFKSGSNIRSSLRNISKPPGSSQAGSTNERSDTRTPINLQYNRNIKMLSATSFTKSMSAYFQRGSKTRARRLPLRSEASTSAGRTKVKWIQFHRIRVLKAAPLIITRCRSLERKLRYAAPSAVLGVNDSVVRGGDQDLRAPSPNCNVLREEMPENMGRQQRCEISGRRELFDSLPAQRNTEPLNAMKGRDGVGDVSSIQPAVVSAADLDAEQIGAMASAGGTQPRMLVLKGSRLKWMLCRGLAATAVV